MNAEQLRALAVAKRHLLGLYARRAHVGRDREFMASGEKLQVVHAREPLEVRAWGAGATVLFVHGMALSGGRFRHLIPAVVHAGFRAVAFDAPAHGASVGTFADSDEVADAIFSIRDELGAFSGLIAHSMGVTWALRAMHAGLTVPKVVCIGAHVSSDPVEAYLARRPLDAAVASHLRRLAAAFSFGMACPLTIAAGMQTRALVVHDKDDPISPFDGGVALAAAWASSEAVWTSGLGHFTILADPAVAARVATFLR